MASRHSREPIPESHCSQDTSILIAVKRARVSLRVSLHHEVLPLIVLRCEGVGVVPKSIWARAKAESRQGIINPSTSNDVYTDMPFSEGQAGDGGDEWRSFRRELGRIWPSNGGDFAAKV